MEKIIIYILTTILSSFLVGMTTTTIIFTNLNKESDIINRDKYMIFKKEEILPLLEKYNITI